MLLCTLAFSMLLAGPQASPPPPRPSTSSTQRRPSDPDESPSNPQSPQKLLKYQHDETKKDIDKLVKLVTEIQEEVDKAGENVLPLNALKKLDEVERMTKKIRGKLKQ